MNLISKKCKLKKHCMTFFILYHYQDQNGTKEINVTLAFLCGLTLPINFS